MIEFQWNNNEILNNEDTTVYVQPGECSAPAYVIILTSWMYIRAGHCSATEISAGKSLPWLKFSRTQG